MREARRWQGVLRGEAPHFEVNAVHLPDGEVNDVPSLNSEQRAAGEMAGRARDLMLGHGPPGTGRTTVLGGGIRRAPHRGEGGLAAAPPNLPGANPRSRLVAPG